MTPHTMLIRVLSLAWACLCVGSVAAAEPARKPNVVVVLCDDLGYGDLGCYGNKVIQTPNVDRFAAQGMRLTNCYAAAANCSPSRAGMMTGRTPYRCGIYNWIPDGSPVYLRKQEVTVATLLKTVGYATCHVGKWHLNGKLGSPEQPQPSDHGFDYWFSTQNIAEPTHRNPANFVRNGKPVGPLEGYAAGLVVDEAIGWLRGRKPEQPFALFVWFHEPHEYLATADEFTKLYPNVDDPRRAIYYGNVTQMDHAFGRLMKTLDDLKLRDDTLVWFTSDNGPAYKVKHPYGSAGPLRAMKGHVYEGGIRVPGILRWPGKTRPGQVGHEPIIFTDLLPTACALTGARVPADRPIDGASFLPIFDDKPIVRTTPLYWQFNRAESTPKVALRQGDWKIVATLTGPELKPAVGDRAGDMEIMKKAELDAFELYNLKQDLGEKTDLAAQEPERLKSMKDSLAKLYRAIKAEGPTWPAWERPKK